MRKLSAVKQQAKEDGFVTLDQLVGLLGPEELDAIDARIRQMRESYQCPYTERNDEKFKATLVEFWARHTA